jgi:phospholipase/carboxylesterase
MDNEPSTVIRYDSPDISDGRDVVYLHGRGSNEREAGWALPLFGRSNVRSYRGPLPEGNGFAWFRSSEVGIARADSLERERGRLRNWIAADSGRQRPWLCGFSHGGAMAASLLLADPHAFSGLVMIASCFPVADSDLAEGRLDGVPVLFCRGSEDRVIPAEKFAQAERYLAGPSAARATIMLYEGGHELPLTIKGRVQAWLRQHDSQAN